MLGASHELRQFRESSGVPARPTERSDGAVHYLRFPVGEGASNALRDASTSVGLLSRCRGHATFVELSAELRELLAQDLCVATDRIEPHAPAHSSSLRPSRAVRGDAIVT
jgi:hypothetical protein